MTDYRFIADSMMGKEAKWLRILGYYTFYESSIDDIYLVELASKRKNGVLITRDRELFHKGVDANIYVFYMFFANINRFIDSFKRFFSSNIEIDFSKTRCPKCNGKLIKVLFKRKIKQIIPSYIYMRYNIFYQCIRCGQIYWPGSHLKNMKKVLAGEISEYETHEGGR